MWEKLNKIQVQVIVAVICVVSMNGLAFLMFFKAIPPENKDVATYMMGMLNGATVGGVFGWLYTLNKSRQQP